MGIFEPEDITPVWSNESFGSWTVFTRPPKFGYGITWEKWSVTWALAWLRYWKNEDAQRNG